MLMAACQQGDPAAMNETMESASLPRPSLDQVSFFGSFSFFRGSHERKKGVCRSAVLATLFLAPMLANSRAPTVTADVPHAVMLADRTPHALSAPLPLAVVLTNA